MDLNSYKDRSKFIKKLIFWSILIGGILTLIFSYTQAGSLEINNNFLLSNISVSAQTTPSNNQAAAPKDVCEVIGSCLSGVKNQKGGSDGIATFIVGLAQTLVFISIAIAVAAIVWGSVMMITSNGEEDKYKKGLTTLQYAITGVVLGIVSFSIIYLVTIVVPNLSIF